MIKLNVEKYEYKALFKLDINPIEHKETIVGTDNRGNYIYHQRVGYELGKALTFEEIYYVLDREEYLLHLGRARGQQRITEDEFDAFRDK
ncbi:MAG: hypothetical protein MJ150_04315 [Clostridia bacterium]|nr:hypothetical protein [Clostridia bacterium]